MRRAITRESNFLFINSCLGRWQSVPDLGYIMQADRRTVRRTIKTFEEMCATNELDSFKIERQEVFNLPGHNTFKVRILLKS